MIRILVADDHPIVREGLKRLLAEPPDMEVVGEAADRDEALAKCAEGGVDVLLLDVSMPGKTRFLDTLRLLGELPSPPRILVLSMHSEDLYAVRSLRAGASGYLSKDHSPEELSGAIRQIYQGGKFVTPTLAEKLAFQLEPETGRPAHEELSDREYQVLQLLAGGLMVKEIGGQLNLSPKTVSTYRSRVMEKMGFKTTADLVRYAVRHDLIEG